MFGDQSRRTGETGLFCVVCIYLRISKDLRKHSGGINEGNAMFWMSRIHFHCLMLMCLSFEKSEQIILVGGDDVDLCSLILFFWSMSN